MTRTTTVQADHPTLYLGAKVRVVGTNITGTLIHLDAQDKMHVVSSEPTIDGHTCFNAEGSALVVL